MTKRRFTVTYGPARSHRADLLLPTGTGPFPVVVLVHGGFWRRPYGRRLMVGLARDVVQHGWAAWNIEYRRVGQQGGGWPGTLEDVAAAVDALADLDALAGLDVPLDLERVVAVGHSAGGHLALWLASRPGLPAGTPGAAPRVTVAAAVSLAGVADLVAGADEGLGRDACQELLGGGPDDVPDRYAMASPMARLPLGVPLLAVHGDADDRVPISQSETFVAAAAAAGDRAELVALPGVDHFAVIDPADGSWDGGPPLHRRGGATDRPRLGRGGARPAPTPTPAAAAILAASSCGGGTSASASGPGGDRCDRGRPVGRRRA